jgi:hypothetical protein
VGESPAEHLPPRASSVRLPGGDDLPRAGRLLASGLYETDAGPLAVNLVSEKESDNTLAPAGETAPAGEAPGASAGTGPRVRETGLAGALAALGSLLLAAEWIVSASRGG